MSPAPLSGETPGAPLALLLDTEPLSIELLGRAGADGPRASSWLVRVVLRAALRNGPLFWSQLVELGPREQREWARTLTEFSFNDELRFGGGREPLLVVRRVSSDPTGTLLEHTVGLNDCGDAPTAQTAFATTALDLTFAAHALELLEEAHMLLPPPHRAHRPPAEDQVDAPPEAAPDDDAPPEVAHPS